MAPVLIRFALRKGACSILLQSTRGVEILSLKAASIEALYVVN